LGFTKGNQTIKFDIEIPTKNGCIFGIYLKRNVEVSAMQIDEFKISVNQAHERLGHVSEELTRKISQDLGWQISKGQMDVCNACSVAKARQKNVTKAAVQSDKPNERVFLDLARIEQPLAGPKVLRQYWRIIVDEFTQLKFSEFYESKDGMVEPTCMLFEKWRQDGKPVKYLRLDNAGENIGLQKRSDSADWKLNIKFEYTAADTPQQNHLLSWDLLF
jgi:hypothetical protein